MARNKIETLKDERHPLDILPDIYQWAQNGVESVHPDDFERLKWFGLFHRKATPGYFMLRIRIPNGIATAEQVRAIAEISERCGRGAADVTTRQAVQLRWITIEDVPWVLHRLAAAGLTSHQSGMDNVRNVVGCPLVGLAEGELIDTRPLAARLQHAVVGRRDLTNLPRKFNISVSGCPEDCTHAQSHDLSFTVARATVDRREVLGFNVLVGGALGGQHPMLAEALDAFVPPARVVRVALAILEVFRDHGSREQRGAARLKWLLQDWGVQRFRAEVEAYLGEPLPRAGQSLVAAHGGDHVGVTEQRDGARVVGLLVPVGRTDATQLCRLARLAEEFGSGEVRFTVQQNVLIPDVPAERVDALLAEPLLTELSPAPSPFVRGLVTCTGNDYCHFSLIDTKGEALALAKTLDERYEVDEPVRLHVSGCPHACGLHRLGEIGLQGDRVRLDGEVRDAAHVFVGGEVGPDARLAEPFADGVLLTDLPVLVAERIEALRGPAALRRRTAGVS